MLPLKFGSRVKYSTPNTTPTKTNQEKRNRWGQTQFHGVKYLLQHQKQLDCKVSVSHDQNYYTKIPLPTYPMILGEFNKFLNKML